MKKPLLMGLGLAALLALLIILSSRPDINTVHNIIVGFSIPQNAKNIQVERSNIFNSWYDDYCIISYNLEPSSLIKMLDKAPPGFLDWKPLGEIGVGPHLFTSAEMHHTKISSKTDGRLYDAVLVDLDHNTVYVMSVFN